MPIVNSVITARLRQRFTAAVTRWHNNACSRCHQRTARMKHYLRNESSVPRHHTPSRIG